MLIKTEGVVLKQTKFRDSDKILTIFTDQIGKVQAIARGVRKPKSKLISSTQIFSYSDFVLYKGRNLYIINQGDVYDSHYSLREDLEKLAYATYIMELVNSATVEGQLNYKLFQLLIKTLKVLTNLKGGYEKLIRAFELKYISFVGFRPYISKCVNCNRDLLNAGQGWFSINHGGILCEKCVHNDKYAIKIDSSVIKGIYQFLYCKLDELHAVKISRKTLGKIENITVQYILYCLEKNSFKSMKFIKSIK